MAKHFYSLVYFIAVLSLMSCKGVAKIKHHKWDVKYEFRSPDCCKKLVITINGIFPGPTIKAEQGDTIIVEVTNNLFTENLAIHWHGIRQIGTPWYDGTNGVTQCPILPGDTFVYKFVVDRAGTFLYHSHYGMQRTQGLNGMIEVSLPLGQSHPFSYDFDSSILLMDWYHKSASELAALITSTSHTMEDPQSLLIEGRGSFDSPLAERALRSNMVMPSTSHECSPFVLTVVSGKTYRLRIGSLTFVSSLNFEIEGHNMTIIEADGHYVEPLEVQSLYIYSGETYSVLVKANQDPSRNYWVTSNTVGQMQGTPTGLAIFNYYPNPPNRNPPTTPSMGPMMVDSIAPRLAQSRAIKAREGFIQHPPATSDRVIMLLITENMINGYMKWAVNNVSLTLPNTPYLVALKNKKLRHKIHLIFDQNPPPNSYDWQNYDIYRPPPNVNATSSNNIYRLELNTTVDIILQNANMMDPNRCETHPWHLHGHDFWVLSYGMGKFNPLIDPKKFNLDDPILKNTVPLHPYGWTAIRFRADNPGVWLCHCHIDVDMALGMGIVFEEGIEKVGKLPSSIMGCGLTKGLITP
ncbi:L-ascorbate oxidase-like [Amaranthus tricolor]|uniref:L-ascorbate oxidase-like n=1 Tax=Amaranthus tricolor TaxID=29722 RepID=UPI0025904A20|nr:L-ascorbate oxidase-like [Amaranthus tricolor]